MSIWKKYTSSRWLALTLLIVLSFVVSACVPVAPVVEEEAAPAVEEAAPEEETAPVEEAEPMMENVDSIAITVSRSTAGPWPQTIVAEEMGFYKAVGLEVETLKSQSGRDAFSALIGGAADIATVALTPMVFAAFQEQPIAIIVENASNPKNVIVARADAGIESAEDLRGKKISTTTGTDLHYFLDAFLAAYGMTEADVEVVNAPPNDHLTILQRGDVDAFAIWQPFPYLAEREMGDNAVILAPPAGTYEARYLISTTQDFLAENPEAIERFLEAFKLADEYIAANPDETLALVAGDIGTEVEELEGYYFDSYRIGLRLEPTLLDEAVAQAQWAIDTGAAPEGADIPDFMSLIFPGPLSAVYPEAVTLEKSP